MGAVEKIGQLGAHNRVHLRSAKICIGDEDAYRVEPQGADQRQIMVDLRAVVSSPEAGPGCRLWIVIDAGHCKGRIVNPELTIAQSGQRGVHCGCLCRQRRRGIDPTCRGGCLRVAQPPPLVNAPVAILQQHHHVVTVAALCDKSILARAIRLCPAKMLYQLEILFGQGNNRAVVGIEVQC